MQFIESSFMGVRAACLRLRSTPEKPNVCLFPMIHIGTPEYYAEVKRRLESCDVVLYEGAPTFQTWLVTRSYVFAASRKRLGLVVQSSALTIPLLQQKRIRADVTAEQFEKSWRQIPVHHRLMLLVGAPLYGLWLYMTASRRSIGRRLSIEEVESQKELERDDRAPELHNAVMTARDERLVQEISSAIAQHNASKTIGIIYGAAHMRVASRLLTEHFKYRVFDSEWITVFDYPD